MLAVLWASSAAAWAGWTVEVHVAVDVAGLDDVARGVVEVIADVRSRGGVRTWQLFPQSLADNFKY
ncbi:hypothetical protein AB0H12_30075 [Actinosynnema sp. NPDC023794]